MSASSNPGDIETTLASKKEVDENIILKGKHIVLLQGPVGPFFKRFSQSLSEQSAYVTHVCFNSADDFFSDSKFRVRFRETDCQWGDWLSHLHQERQIELIILFGCERPRHVEAIQFGKTHNIPVLSLEEGYIRPGYITAEINGNNRQSPLIHADLSVDPSQIPASPTPASGHAFNHMAWYGFLYYIIRQLGITLGSPASHHKQRKLIPEAFYWLRNVWRKQSRKHINAKLIDTLFTSLRKQYVIVPMQVRDDGQLIAAGRGWNNERVIEELIPSFAKHAPKDLFLVFKAHPLERGHTDADKRIKRLANQHNVSGRVLYIDDGSIGQITKHSKAMITINSTSALSAIHFNVPLAVLGDAMFRRPELSTCINSESDIDKFWNRIPEPNSKTNEAFLLTLKSTSILPGDYYSKKNTEISKYKLCEKIESILTRQDLT